MKNTYRTSLLSSVFATGALALSVAISAPAVAQVTTSDIVGTVVTDTGAPVSGAVVTVSNSATGFVRSVSTDTSGGFAVRNLSLTGLYDVSVTSNELQGERVEGIALSLGDTTNLRFELEGGTAVSDEIVVVGQLQVLADLAVGPSSTFNLADLESVPAINRDIKDVVRLDPRVYLDESFADAVQCAGANPRFNSLTVDGLRLNDNFGLNSNGYPTERIPFSYDAIEQVSVELAPFDVEYGGFTACNINAVTKSGTNEFHGGVFVDYTNDSLRGDQAADRPIDNGDFDEYRYGINVGGPIIKDKVFFFAAYEKQEGSDLFGNNTPAGKGLTDAQYQEIVDIAQSVYGYQSGGLPTSLSNSDEKFLGKIDWNINNQHRASFTYNYNDGFSSSPSDGDPNELPELNHFYRRGATLNSYAGSLYSDWSDNFSTELSISYIDLVNLQDSYGGLVDQIGEVQINVGDSIVYLGPDDSRHANELNYDLITYKAKANYSHQDHFFTFGFEHEAFDVFNLFVQENQTEVRFDSIEDFRNGDANRLIYESAAGTNNVDDGAAEFGYSITTIYAQDDWQVSDKLSLALGLRAEFYSSKDEPALNTNFRDTYGIPNNENLGGKSIIQPRFGFSYDYAPNLTFRGGAGLFSGGNPNVWISNNYSNNGVTLAEFQERGINIINDYNYNGGRPLFDIPQEALDFVANAQGEGAVNALDPDFNIPSEWKFALGLTYDFDSGYKWIGDGYTVNADILYSKVKDAAFVSPISWTTTGLAPDGRPIYAGNTDDFLLTNAADKGEALTLSASIAKSYDFGLDWSLGYAYSQAEDTNPMTSSVAFSNWQNFTRSDAVNPEAATSDYEIPHRFTMQANYEREFFGDFATQFSLFGQISEGSGFSYTFGNPSPTAPNAFFVDNALFYAPTGASDPTVIFDGGPVETQAFYDWVASTDCVEAGEISARNGCNDQWWTKFDLKVSQELPGLRNGDKAKAFVVIENLGNFINSDWGVQYQQGFPAAVDVVDANIVGGQYVYSNFRGMSGEGFDKGAIQVEPSLWEIRFGASYNF